MHTEPIVEIVKSYNLLQHLYTDDRKLVCSCNIDDSSVWLEVMENSIGDLKLQMSTYESAELNEK